MYPPKCAQTLPSQNYTSIIHYGGGGGVHRHEPTNKKKHPPEGKEIIPARVLEFIIRHVIDGLSRGVWYV